MKELRAINPDVRMILTVSPVPLIATYENRHVLVSTTYSKSVLRVAAEMIYRNNPEWVEYFPSYEIITGNYNNSNYYERDYRGINSIGVDHAMRCFLAHFTDPVKDAPTRAATSTNVGSMADIVCDEEAIDQTRI